MADDAHAANAANALGVRWVDLAGDPDAEAVDLDPAIRRASSTEIWDAVNDETRAYADSAVRAGDDTLWLEWSALADACEQCSELHGDRVLATEGFPDWPPLHPHCHCLVLTD